MSAGRRRIVLKSDADLRPFFCKMVCDGYFLTGKKGLVVKACILSYGTLVGDLSSNPPNTTDNV